jgi:hypothetical protein
MWNALYTCILVIAIVYMYKMDWQSLLSLSKLWLLFRRELSVMILSICDVSVGTEDTSVTKASVFPQINAAAFINFERRWGAGFIGGRCFATRFASTAIALRPYTKLENHTLASVRCRLTIVRAFSVSATYTIRTRALATPTNIISCGVFFVGGVYFTQA